MTKKATPDLVLRFAKKLAQKDRKSFNAAMRAHFPRITDYTLREAHKNAKILVALQHIKERQDHDDA